MTNHSPCCSCTCAAAPAVDAAPAADDDKTTVKWEVSAGDCANDTFFLPILLLGTDNSQHIRVVLPKTPSDELNEVIVEVALKTRDTFSIENIPTNTRVRIYTPDYAFELTKSGTRQMNANEWSRAHFYAVCKSNAHLVAGFSGSSDDHSGNPEDAIVWDASFELQDKP